MNDRLILCIKRDSISSLFNQKISLIKKEKIDFNSNFMNAKYFFLPREEVENKPEYKQLIPYIIIIDNNDNVLLYERSGKEKRLHGLYSCGIGGHIDIEDTNEINELKNILRSLNFDTDNFYKNWLNLNMEVLQKIIYHCAIREIYEETGIIVKENNNGSMTETFDKTHKNLEFIGLINEDESSVGNVHLGLVYIYKIGDLKKTKIEPKDNEIKKYIFCKSSNIFERFTNLELWSKLALELIRTN